jgi:DNA-binding NarL/FixJ family response regulator
MPRRILAIADDHELVARGLASLLAPHHEVAAIAGSAAELLELLRGTRVDCVLLDIAMPGQTGLELMPELRRRWPGLPVVILSMHADRSLVRTALSLGANGYVPKDAGLDELLKAIERAFSERPYVSSRIPRQAPRSGMDALHPALATLSPQQQRILFLLGEGMSSAAIGEAMGLEECTIAYHRGILRRKLGVESELGLNRVAVLLRAELP